jgi:hypothetical protein
LDLQGVVYENHLWLEEVIPSELFSPFSTGQALAEAPQSGDV